MPEFLVETREVISREHRVVAQSPSEAGRMVRAGASDLVIEKSVKISVRVLWPVAKPITAAGILAARSKAEQS